MIIIYVYNRNDYKDVVEVFKPMIREELVEVNLGNLFTDNIDRHSYILTPGNSFGVMDGGFDAVLKENIKCIEPKVRKKIDMDYKGELPIGSAIEIDPGDDDPLVIYTSTMRIPGRIPYASIAVYSAFREALRLVDDVWNVNVFTPMFGTGYGSVSAKKAATQMYMAIRTMKEPINRNNWEVIRRSQRIIETGELITP